MYALRTYFYSCSRLVLLPLSKFKACYSFLSFLFPVFFSSTIWSRMSSSDILGDACRTWSGNCTCSLHWVNYDLLSSSQGQNVFNMHQTLRRFNSGEMSSPFSHTHTFTHFSFIFLIIFTERACPQLAKANLGGLCLDKQITKIYRQKLVNKKKKYNNR